ILTTILSILIFFITDVSSAAISLVDQTENLNSKARRTLLNFNEGLILRCGPTFGPPVTDDCRSAIEDIIEILGTSQLNVYEFNTTPQEFLAIGAAPASTSTYRNYKTPYFFISTFRLYQLKFSNAGTCTIAIYVDEKASVVARGNLTRLCRIRDAALWLEQLCSVQQGFGGMLTGLGELIHFMISWRSTTTPRVRGFCCNDG
ncbi:hypothetical protein MMC12_008619, partial [Toensbergia leucococca]|nr:hypothetical protein [Toensbergia leucococca]